MREIEKEVVEKAGCEVVQYMHPETSVYLCYHPELTYARVYGAGIFANDAYDNYIEDVRRWASVVPEEKLREFLFS